MFSFFISVKILDIKDTPISTTLCFFSLDYLLPLDIKKKEKLLNLLLLKIVFKMEMLKFVQSP